MFRGCVFERLPGDDDPLVFFNGKTLTFLGCRFQAARLGAPLWVTGDPYHGAFRDCLLFDSQSESTPFGQQQWAHRRLRVLPGAFYEEDDEDRPLRWASSAIVTGVTPGAERDWRRGDRVRAPAPAVMPYLRPGTYLRKVAAGTFELSAPARRGGAAIRLFDADMRAVQFRP